MLNVRIDSLPPDRETSNKDCRQCNKRRIRCDRTLPRCRKCTIRGFQCPGYQPLQLKWGHQAASREQSEGNASAKRHGSSKSSKRAIASDRAVQAASHPGSDISDLSALIASPRSHTPDRNLLSPTVDRDLIEGFASVTISEKLFTHFNSNVAPRLTWVDTPDHPWRKLMYPMAKRCPCLHLSILSVAAAHLTSTSPANHHDSQEIQVMNTRLREASLRTLNNMLRVELEKFNSPNNTRNGTTALAEILATTLVLCYGEMLVPNSTDWNLHLHACRVLIERHQWRIWQNKTPDAATSFLMREVSDIEVFRTFGAFTRDPNFTSVLPPRTILDSHFGAFTGLLWEITMEERRRHSLLQEGQSLPRIDMLAWRTRMDHAFTRASTDTANLSSTHGENTQDWMNAIVRSVYYASLIYCFQALATKEEAQIAIDTSLPHLNQDIDFVTAGPVHFLSHDIFLPLFIAGTESWADPTRQATIERLFVELISDTGLWCNRTALHVLKSFWKSENFAYHSVGKWIQFARENEQDNGPFLIF